MFHLYSHECLSSYSFRSCVASGCNMSQTLMHNLRQQQKWAMGLLLLVDVGGMWWCLFSSQCDFWLAGVWRPADTCCVSLKRRGAASNASSDISSGCILSPGRGDTKACCVTNWGALLLRIKRCVCVVTFIKTFLHGLGRQRARGLYIIKCMLFTWNAPLKAGSLRPHRGTS